MKKTLLAAALLSTTFTAAALAGDAQLGKQKAGACVACHGSDSFGGVFYTLQLAGRDADKLTVKTMKYKNGKTLHPVMNLATAFYTEKDIEDISAYYKALGKPAVTSPFFKIAGDEDLKSVPAAAAPAAAAPAASTPAAAPAAPYATGKAIYGSRY